MRACLSLPSRSEGLPRLSAGSLFTRRKTYYEGPTRQTVLFARQMSPQTFYCQKPEPVNLSARLNSCSLLLLLFVPLLLLKSLRLRGRGGGGAQELGSGSGVSTRALRGFGPGLEGLGQTHKRPYSVSAKSTARRPPPWAVRERRRWFSPSPSTETIQHAPQGRRIISVRIITSIAIYQIITNSIINIINVENRTSKPRHPCLLQGKAPLDH